MVDLLRTEESGKKGTKNKEEAGCVRAAAAGSGRSPGLVITINRFELFLTLSKY